MDGAMTIGFLDGAWVMTDDSPGSSVVSILTKCLVFIKGLIGKNY
jgi:hypothetical protein